MQTSSTLSTPVARASDKGLRPALDRCGTGVVYLEAGAGPLHRFRCGNCGRGTRFHSVIEWASLLFERRRPRT
jgi:hypothetical protein